MSQILRHSSSDGRSRRLRSRRRRLLCAEFLVNANPFKNADRALDLLIAQKTLTDFRLFFGLLEFLGTFSLLHLYIFKYFFDLFLPFFAILILFLLLRRRLHINDNIGLDPCAVNGPPRRGKILARRKPQARAVGEGNHRLHGTLAERFYP